jgi:hypothetical protein
MANKTGTMERQRSKFIYEFLPYNTFNHAHNSLSGQIRYVKPHKNDHGELIDDPNNEETGLPKNYVVSRIHRKISKWHNADALRDYLDVDESETDSIIFVNPGGASYTLFPRTFECNACDSIRSFGKEEMEAITSDATDEELVCENCGRRFTDRDQLSLVGVCECGGLTGLYIEDHCGAGMALDRTSSQMANWEWKCADRACNHSLNFFARQPFCPNSADCGNENMDIMNHMSSHTYYPQVETLINTRPKLDNIYRRSTYRARIASDYLIRGLDFGNPTDDEVEDRAADHLGGWKAYGKATPSEREDAKELAYDELTEDVSDHRTATEGWLEDEFEDDDAISESELAEELYEFLSIVPDADEYTPAGGLESRSYQEMVDAEAENTHLSLPVVKEYNERRRSLNLSEVRLLKDFPITTVSYGYTRMRPSPRDADDLAPGESNAQADRDAGDSEGDDGDGESERDIELNLFMQRDDDGYSRPHMFTQQHNAEAVLIRLDKLAVLEWLETNGVIDAADLPDLDDTEDVRRWFLSNIITPGRYEDLPINTPHGSRSNISRHCFTLLNTTAHLFINSISALAGHQRESLKERLMPHTMSFVVYKSPDADFALGTIWTLFEEQFKEFVEHLHDLNDCSYDPVCLHDENGACEDCLYLPAFATENTNHNLGRATFYGGPFDNHDTDEASAPFDDLTGFADLTTTADRAAQETDE